MNTDQNNASVTTGIINAFEPNALGRDFIIGDLHGCYGLFQAHLDHVEFDPAKDRIFSVGDLIDRGPDSFKCLQLLDEPWFHAVYANHEDLMCYFLGTKDDPYNYGHWWYRNGGNWYDNCDDTRFLVKDLAKKAVELPRLITVKGQFHVIHAEVFSDVELTDEDLANPECANTVLMTRSADGECGIWGRELFMELYAREHNQTVLDHVRKSLEQYHWAIQTKCSPIFSGHTIVTNPAQIGQCINIDTGAFTSTKHDEFGLTMYSVNSECFYKANRNGIVEVQPTVIL